MRRSVRYAMLAAAVASLAACSANPFGPATGVCRAGDSCSSSDFINPNADFINPNADFINPNADFINPNADFINPNADFINPNADFINPNASVVTVSE